MSRRLVFSHIVSGARCSAKVYRDADTYGYLVRFFMHGVHHVPADYECETQAEAISTARHEVNRINATPEHGRYRVNGSGRLFCTLEEAQIVAAAVHARTGVFVSIELEA